MNINELPMDDAFEIALMNQEHDHMEEMEAGFDDEQEEHDPFLHDGEADADALASCGMGTDEDYGCYGGGEE